VAGKDCAKSAPFAAPQNAKHAKNAHLLTAFIESSLEYEETFSTTELDSCQLRRGTGFRTWLSIWCGDEANMTKPSPARSLISQRIEHDRIFIGFTLD
jgi:hypothetical protein